MLSPYFGTWFLLAVLGSCTDWVYPDSHWNDTDGNRIEAHAAGMLQSPGDGRWYWYGESKKQEHQTTTTEGINCYSAETIAGPWRFEGQILKQQDVVVPGQHGPWVMQRPKVLFNDATKKFVLWFHLDQPKHKMLGKLELGGYQFRSVGVAQADNPGGPFTWVRSFQPDGIPSLDMSLFKDPLDGQAYFIRDCAHKYVGISRLSPDFLNTTGVIAKVPECEGMAMFRLKNGTYYMITSHTTGWSPNPLIAWRSESNTTLDNASWINLGNPTQDKTSFNTQPTYIVEYTPKQGNPYYVYLADDWLHCPNGYGTGGAKGLGSRRRKDGSLVDACYVWLPIRLDKPGDALPLQIDDYKKWDLDNPFAIHSESNPQPIYA